MTVIVSWKLVHDPVFYEKDDPRLEHIIYWDLEEMLLEDAIVVCGQSVAE